MTDIVVDSFLLFDGEDSSYVDLEAEIQHKQGYQKHFKRRVNDRRAKRHNKRLWIDVYGQSKWYFYQSHFYCTYYGPGWPFYLKEMYKCINDILKNYLVDSEWHDDKYGKDAVFRRIRHIELEVEVEKNAEDLLPSPSEEEMVHQYRRYRDTDLKVPQIDRSGRSDARQKIKEKLDKKEICDYLVEYSPVTNCPLYLDPYWEDFETDLLRCYPNAEDYSFLAENYANQTDDSDFVDCPHCGLPDYACRCDVDALFYSDGGYGYFGETTDIPTREEDYC